MPPRIGIPGSFKVQSKRDGSYVLVGVRTDGTRVRFKVGSLTEGHTLARSIFQGAPAQPTGQVPPPSSPNAAVDEFGLPVDYKLPEFGLPVDYKLPEVSPETVRVGAPPAAPAGPGPGPDPVKLERKGNAKSLAELIGLGGALGPAMLANKFLEPRYEYVPKPSKKHMNDLANEITAAITESFGDREVGHWTMVILLSIGIPISMWIQASGPKKKVEPSPPAEREPLQSVP